MTQPSKARAVTIAILAVAALVAIGREAGWQRTIFEISRQARAAAGSGASAPALGDARPQDAIYRMLDAAGQGDSDAYLGCYAGSLRRSLEQSRDEMTPAKFAQYLAQTNQPIKGIAVSQPTALSETEVEVRVEFVYQDRNESQQFVLEKSAGEWKIARVGGAGRVETPVPYGTSVY
jgi:hypothetical protein